MPKDVGWRKVLQHRVDKFLSRRTPVAPYQTTSTGAKVSTVTYTNLTMTMDQLYHSCIQTYPT